MLTIEEALIANTSLEHIDFVENTLCMNGVLMRENWPSHHGEAPTDEQIAAWMAA